MVSVALQWVANGSTSLDIPNTYRYIIGSTDNVVPIWGTAEGCDCLRVSSPLQRRRWPRQQLPLLRLDGFREPPAEGA